MQRHRLLPAGARAWYQRPWAIVPDLDPPVLPPSAKTEAWCSGETELCGALAAAVDRFARPAADRLIDLLGDGTVGQHPLAPAILVEHEDVVIVADVHASEEETWADVAAWRPDHLADRVPHVPERVAAFGLGPVFAAIVEAQDVELVAARTAAWERFQARRARRPNLAEAEV